MTTTNEAAERLRQWFDDGYSTVGGDHRPYSLLDEALAAESRATVERLLDADDWRHEALKILDEEAAR